MAMTENELNDAIDEAERFIRRAVVARDAVRKDRVEWDKWLRDNSYLRNAPHPGAAKGACRRASVDLTRALAALRRY